MRYLVTGTGGFIGFHLARRLLAAGHAVTGFDGMTHYYDVRLKRQRHEILCAYDNFDPVIGMLEDKDALERAASIERPDVIIHLAAQAGVRYSLEEPGTYVSANINGSWQILELAKAVKPKHLLLASSSSVYGANESIPFLESDHADEPLTIYAATKKAMEAMGHSYAHLHKVPTTAFRFFTVYGPWGRPDMALFKFTDAIINHRPVEIYSEGRMSRDFTYIDDLVEAIVRLADIPPAESNRIDAADVVDTLSRHAPFRVINIGAGLPVELIRFVDIVEEAIGQQAIRRYLPPQKGDVPRTFADQKLLKALTGFVPQTPLEEGVREFVKWYRAWSQALRDDEAPAA
ncbi:NAD-dependent epimerase/dehydratase family protein [Agrobacterium sp. a22-2]|uniref:NAD-dependent epimerase/dehydratase family protein n=1 Tax=Agrobacterium sp. a22-2 TaxID=2283840 RepID=UPI0014474014|nr:NAD-dependent epimerase/dehydratase family protein [Agrobacterium sp. a22-2]NKN37536.1 NAD-dependent epimerase/dehydratase family protein [Agrobacterium sp. a22-2]